MVLSKDLKIAICFGLIIGVILSICNLCFATEREVVNPTAVLGLDYNDGVVSTGSYALYYIPIEPGYQYTVESDVNWVEYAFTNEVPGVNVPYYDHGTLESGVPLTFNGGSSNYLFVSSYQTVHVTFYREPLEGMGGFIDEFVYSLSVNGVWDTVLACVPLIAICVLFGFGVFNIVRFLRLIIKTRGGM